MSLIEQPRYYYHGQPDKREIPRIKLASLASIDSSKWDLELSQPETAPELEKLLTHYRDQSLEDNLFFGKPFLAAAFGRMNTLETNLLTVWETQGNNRYLRMYFPVVPDHLGLPGHKVWRCWSHDYAPLGVPCLSDNEPSDTLDRFLQLMALANNSVFSAMVFHDIPLQGSFAKIIRESLENSDTDYSQFKTGERGIIQQNTFNPSDNILDITSKKRRQFRRQQRRLGEMGTLEFEQVANYKDMILRFEEFLLLEAKGWKGRNRTSMQTIKQTAAFARQAVTELAKSGKSEIYSIRLDNKSIASLIMLNSNGTYYPWKIAFDQQFALYSPGALLMFKASEAVSNKADFKRADSLASSNNRLVNPLWKKRMDMGTLILPMGDTGLAKIEKISRAIERKQNLRNWAKAKVNKIPFIGNK